MARIIDDVSEFRADRPWGARDLAEINGATVRLHWSDQPYMWHVNDGPEVFIVLSGEVDMRFKRNGEETSVRLGPSDIFVADIGDEHVAHPIGEARILVVEQKGSI
jgi:mannose-6-phosphate isomerase-like protein (cupin superfamily)